MEQEVTLAQAAGVLRKVTMQSPEGARRTCPGFADVEVADGRTLHILEQEPELPL